MWKARTRRSIAALTAPSGPPAPASEKRAWYDSFLVAYAEISAQGLSRLNEPPDDLNLINSIYFLADKDAPGGVFKLIFRGVEVYSETQHIGSSRGVVLASAEGLQFDASTLKVVQNDSFEAKLGRVRAQVELLRNEVMMRRGMVPREFQFGPGSLY